MNPTSRHARSIWRATSARSAVEPSPTQGEMSTAGTWNAMPSPYAPSISAGLSDGADNERDGRQPGDRDHRTDHQAGDGPALREPRPGERDHAEHRRGHAEGGGDGGAGPADHDAAQDG